MTSAEIVLDKRKSKRGEIRELGGRWTDEASPVMSDGLKIFTIEALPEVR